MGSAPIRFDGQVAIVTGAGHGLGRAYAIALAARGASVLCNDINADAADETVRVIAEQRGSAIAHASTVATPEGGAGIVQATLDRFGTVDVLINNAGQLRNAAFETMTVDEFGDVIATHLMGAFHVTQPAYRAMQAASYGRIVFTSSAAGMFGSPWQANYAAAKAGVVGLCKVVALEGAVHGIAANAVMPMALTGIGRDGPAPFAPEQLQATIDALRPLVPYMTVENVTPTVLYLASKDCACNGQIVSVGAGHVGEVFVGATRGWYAPELVGMTPEQVAVDFDVALDRSAFCVPESMNAESAAIAAGIPQARP